MCHFETQIVFYVWANTAHNLTPVYLHNSHSRLLRQKEGSFPEWQRSWKNAFITALKTAVARFNPTNRPDFGALSRKSSMGLPTKSQCLERSRTGIHQQTKSCLWLWSDKLKLKSQKRLMSCSGWKTFVVKQNLNSGNITGKHLRTHFPGQNFTAEWRLDCSQRLYL